MGNRASLLLTKPFTIKLGCCSGPEQTNARTEKYMESSGLSDICVESEVLGKTNVMNTLKGTPVELWPLFLTWAKENAKDLGGSLKDLTQRLAEGYSTGQNEDRFDAYVALTESLSKFPDSLRILVQHTRVTRLSTNGGVGGHPS